MAERKTIVYPNPEMLAQAVAARTLLTIIDLLAEPGRRRVDIAVTGGTDGNRVFAAMNASPLNDAVDWNRVHVWWGDERFVAADDDDRNAKQAREAWYGALVEDGRMPAGNVHAMPADTRSATEIASASPEQTDAVLAEAAAEYQRELAAQLGENPALDIAMFGMGPDADRADDRPFEAYVGVHIRNTQGQRGQNCLRATQQPACPKLLRRRRGTALAHRQWRRLRTVIL